MATIITDGKGNYFTPDDSGQNWVPTAAPDTTQQGGHRFTDAPPEEPKKTTSDASNAADFADVPGGGSRPEVQPQAGSGGWGAWVDTSIQPGPNVGTIVPFSADPATGHVRVALPNAVRAILTESPQGYLPGPPGQPKPRFETPAATINPDTGTLGVTPEMLAGAGLFSSSNLLFGGANRAFVPPGTFDRGAPLSPEFLQNPLGPSLSERPMPEPGGPTSATGVPPQAPTPEKHAVPRPGEQGASPSATAVPAAASEADQILASAKSVANQHYDIAKANGQDSSYTPASVGKMVDAVDSAAPQGPGERAVGGENAVTRLQRDMQPLRDQPLTLADVQAMDERMSDHITEELRAGRNKVAGQLQDIQQKWREQADGVTADDVTGGQAGFQALDPARQAWAQYRKMSDVMLMKQRADMTQNPTSSYQTAVKNFVTGRASRGWTDEEKAALQASADRGAIGGTLHLLGSRLLPHVGGAVGASIGGIPGFVAGEVVTHGMGAGARNLANAMQTGRVNRAMGVLGSSVPAPPINEMLRY